MEAGRSTLPLRAIVADGQALFSDVLAEQLNYLRLLTVVGRTSDGHRLLDLLGDHRPELVILDGQLPGANSLEIVRALRRLEPGLRIVLLTGQESDQFLYECVRAGVDAYLVKTTTSLRELGLALEAVARGESYIAPLSLQHAIRTNALRQTDGEPGGRLSAREREILRWLARGLSTKEIASHSGLSHATVRNHISSMYRKLGVPTRAGLVLYALQSGVIPSNV